MSKIVEKVYIAGKINGLLNYREVFYQADDDNERGIFLHDKEAAANE